MSHDDRGPGEDECELHPVFVWIVILFGIVLPILVVGGATLLVLRWALS